VSNWTFASSSNDLQVTADVNGHGGDGQASGDDSTADDATDSQAANHSYQGYNGAWKQYQLNYAIGYVTSYNQATYDGGNTGPVKVAYTLTAKPTVTWTFVSFQFNVSYDPLFGTSGGLQVVPSLLLLIPSFLALFASQ